MVYTECLRYADSETLSAFTWFCGNDHCTVQTSGTVQGSSCRTFQYRYSFKVIRVKVLQLVTVVIGIVITCIPVCCCVTGYAVVKDYTIHNVNRLVVASECRSTTNLYFCTTEKTTVRTRDFNSGNLTLQGCNRWNCIGSLECFTFYFGYGITQRFFFTFQSQSGNNNFFQCLCIVF